MKRRRSPISERSTLGLLFVTSTLEMIGVGMAIPVFAPLIFDPVQSILDPTVSEAIRGILYGVLLASYPFAQFFGTPILGALSDRYGRKPVLIVARAGTLLSYIGTAIGISMGNIWLILAAYLFDGFTGGNISVAQSAIADISDKTNRSSRFGLVGMSFGLGFIIGPLLGGVLSDPTIVPWFSFAMPFWAGSILTLINIIIFAMYFTETLEKRSKAEIHPLQSFTMITKSLKRANLRPMLLVIFLYTLGFNFFTQFFQPYMVTELHFTQRDIGFLFGYTGVWIAIAQGITNQLATKYYSPERIFSVTLILLAATVPLLLVPDTALGLYLLTPFIANFQGLSLPNAIAIISHKAKASEQGEILGITQAYSSLGMIVPPLIGGLIFSVSTALPILLAGLCILLAWTAYAGLHLGD